MKLAIISSRYLFRKAFEGVCTEQIGEINVIQEESAEELLQNGYSALGMIVADFSSRDDLTTDLTPIVRTFSDAGLIVVINTQAVGDLAVLKVLFKEWLRLGIRGFLTLESDEDQIKDCLKSVSQNKRYFCQDLVQWMLDAAFDNTLREKEFSASGVSRLTKREMEIARMLSEGLAVSAIAQKTGRRPSTISTLKKRVFMKTKTDNVIMLRDLLSTI